MNNTAKMDCLGRAIATLREEQGYSQERLAKTSNCKRTEIVKIETGDTDPSLSVLMRIARSLDVKLSALIRRAGKLSAAGECKI